MMITEKKKQKRQSDLCPYLHFLKIDPVKIVGLGQKFYVVSWAKRRQDVAN